ncbi:tRNA (adenosine(37)-N6)-threonylcarbamoyltransferase complex dimerization subunit type 1 TsaB [Nocardioides aequoreus]|uniref:tRNA (adenosine(37)-N6)-threonylcarbamoyltransferase complex dimerization subunit type 1 TsaB n=1 Tax=Nocardioides aequoreus TaxID=397278 RepID=UPI0004C36AC0|nr:tRNA (adenosine(37)-N6)-threonylcarbamoyltransferase complex dimerization subunit type 1 TsaB [Nocardioides aequoreus]
MLLAFDTATSRVTVALHDGDRVVAAYDADEAMRHGEMLAPGIERVLAEAGATVADLDGVAVGVGPGPFTGLRVGLVTARMLALTRGLAVHGVCTLDVIAAEAAREGGDELTVVTDARRKEVYLASYGGGRRVWGPEVVRPEDARLHGRVVGRGGALYPDAFPGATGPEHPSAAVMAEVVQGGEVELLPAEPLYLRRPDAAEPGRPKRVS